MPKQIILFPFGGNAREILISLLDLNKKESRYDILGFADDDPSTWEKQCCGVKVLGGKEVITTFGNAAVIAAPGNPDNYLHRKEYIQGLNLGPDRFATVIAPSAHISPDAKIGYNTAIMPGVVVSCGVTVGNHCIILPNTVISHDSTVDDYTCVGSNVTVSGGVHIHENCYIGSGTQIKDHLEIGHHALVGLGSNVISNVKAETLVAGNPAKTLRKIGP